MSIFETSPDRGATAGRERRSEMPDFRVPHMAFVWILMSLVVLVGVTAVEAATTDPRPRIDVSPQVIDVGVVAQGAVINASVLVANRGNATLKVWQVLGDVAGPVRAIKLDLEPGQEQVVALPPLDTTGFVGPISRGIVLLTNDPEHPQVNILERAEVRAFIEVLPRRFFRVDVEEGKEESGTVLLASKDQFRILSAAAADPRVSVSFERTTQEGFLAAFKLTIRLKGREPYSIVEPEIVVHTSHPIVPTITLRLLGVIKPVVQVIPYEVNFGAVRGTATRNILIAFNG